MVLITTPGMEMKINHKNLNTPGVLSFVLCLPHIGTAFVSASWRWLRLGYTWQPQAEYVFENLYLGIKHKELILKWNVSYK